MKAKTIGVMIVVLMLPAFYARSQNQVSVLTAEEQSLSVEKACRLLNRFYVFPEKALSLEKHLKKSLAEGAFKNLTDPKMFVDRLTAEMRSVVDDKHLAMYLGQAPAPPSGDAGLRRLLDRLESEGRNCGLRKIEILDGNVGYLSIRSVSFSNAAREIIAGAMNFLARTNAVILDVRDNGGGDAGFMQFLFSYFFDRPTHINSIYWRDRDMTQHFSTFAEVPGRKMADVPLFVLINKNTFSGAEEFAYDLQALKRGIVIGETSRGGAHPAATWLVYKNIRIAIPYGRAINPVTKTNWEGAGVKPDIRASEESILETAVREARKAADARLQSKRNRMTARYADLQKALADADALFVQGRNEEADRSAVSGLRTVAGEDFGDEAFINNLGYDFLRGGKHDLAVAILDFNAKTHPLSSNAFDSLGEACRKAGRKSEAVEAYKKALELDPGKATAKTALAELEKER